MIKITVESTVRESVEKLAGELETEFDHSSFGVDLCAILVVRTLRDHPALKGAAEFFKSPKKGGKLTSAQWGDLLARLKVCSNAAAINGSLRGYGKKTGGAAAALVDDVG
jgi:hypothetical protein